MAIEKMRGCGYRKVGGLYLVGAGHGVSCDRLPYELSVCPVCGAGVKFGRGFQWLDWLKYAGGHGLDNECGCPEICPVCFPEFPPQPFGLLWVGEQYYTPQSFIEEALSMGVSKRIAAVPRKLKLGETWVLFAQKSACGTREEQQDNGQMKTVGIPGVFCMFRPRRIEKLIWESEAKPELIEDLTKSGITPVIIPDGDLDHDPTTPLLPDEDTRKEIERSALFGELRGKIMPKETWDVEEG